MALSDEARNRLFIATTDRNVGNEIADAIDNGNAPASYTDATRPDPSTVSAGFMIFNSADNAINVSDGTAWRDALGNLT